MPTTTAASIPPIVQWFQIYGNVVFFFGQMLWWIVTGFAAGWAASLYYRSLKMQQAAALAHAEAAADKEARSGFSEVEKAKDDVKVADKAAADKKADAKADAKAVDVDKFVE
jgi:hypothetical protein